MTRFSWVGIVCFLLLWEGISVLHIVDPFFLPSPPTVARSLMDLLLAPGVENILPDIGATLNRVAVAFFFAVVLGWPLGILIGASSRLYHGTETVIDFFRSIPQTALFPLFLILLGAGEASKIALSSFAAGITVLFHVAHGVVHAKESRVLAARSMGMKSWDMLRRILLWESVPHAYVGLRDGISLSLVIIIVTEMFIGASSGLGHRIIDFQITYDIPGVYAAILATGIIGYALNFVFISIGKKALHWVRK